MMGRNSAVQALARTLAAFGLVAAITIGSAAGAGAAPADRAGDPVVLKGSDLGDLIGTAPGKIVGYRWAGSWVQIPVQVDERHTVDVRTLYPATPTNGYVGNTDPDFDLEVYADPKTRSGADSDASFDADDQFTFMGGDSGAIAPADASPPKGVDGSTGVKVVVEDPVGGGEAYIYLFEAIGTPDQSAGKDYVDYDFKLTNLTGAQTLLNDYGYIAKFNPEDSTVKTDDYELHSFDRWMEDQMKITAGNANGIDILDREVAQAGLNSCGRSEYTFSGRWQQDSTPDNDSSTDNEGTYVAVIDGPVRAIRSYMGANSGPYVQREHIYYRDQEQNTIFLRVHPMGALYSWTDFAPSAIGMTYRDAKNTAGVTVDGVPDSLVPTTTADVANGAYSWQQISGAQGTATTVLGSETDIASPNFGNYYLDDSTPTGANEVQCGGDGQSIGASGFGILGPVTPNTDPRTGTHNMLTTKRTRYFGPPSDGVAQAADYTARVTKPLAASASANPVTGGPAPGPRTVLGVRFPGPRPKAMRGKAFKLKVLVRNSGGLQANRVRLCVRGPKLRGRGACKVFGPLRGRTSRMVQVGVVVKPGASGRAVPVNVSARSWVGEANIRTIIKVPLRR